MAAMNFGSPFFNVGNAVAADARDPRRVHWSKELFAGLGMSRFDLFITLSLAL